MRRLPVSLLAVLLVSSLTAQEAAGNGDGFAAGYQEVRELMAKGRWGKAKDALEGLLVAHQGAEYAIAQRDSIIEDHKRCAFHLDNPEPDPRDVVSGEVLSWSKRSGKIKLRYTPDNLGDWLKQDGGVLIHPVVFAGTYTVNIRGAAYPRGGEYLRVLIDLSSTGDSWYDVVYGCPPIGRQYVPTMIEYCQGSGREKLDEKGMPAVDPGKPYLVTVKVTASSIQALYNKRSQLRAKKHKGPFGRVAFFRQAFTEIVLEGKIESSWLQQAVDEALDKRRKEFERSYRPRRQLPEWLFAALATERTESKDPHKVYPGRVHPGDMKFLNECMGLLNAGRARECIARVTKGTDDDAPGPARDYLLALARHHLGDGEQALTHCEAVAAVDSEFWAVRELRARILEQLQRWDEAIAELQQAVVDDPGEVRLYEPLVRMLLQRERREEAEALLAKAVSEHGLQLPLKDLNRMLRMADKGPDWQKRHRYSSRHYTVHSDIDERLCVEATQILEQAYVTYQAQLSWVKGTRDEKFEVYLFSGEAGYQEYCRQILGAPAAHTAGLYSPVLKQLLIWNVPKREDMMRTVRHEGFHQFLDRVTDAPPIWLNEGMAEYYETSQRTKGRFDGGQRRPQHLAVLFASRSDLPPLRDLVHESRQEFYANARVRYPYAWAFVHFLRKSSRANRLLFERIFEVLQESDGSTRAAMELAFADVDFEQLERELWQHLDAMR